MAQTQERDIKEVLKLLKKKKPMIDAKIEEYIPRDPTQEDLEFLFGEARYSYNTETFREAFSEPIWDFLDRGGKRWRPALFLMLVEAFGGDPDRVKDYVLIPELVHNGSIMIDDIEDDSDMRRGKEAAHKIFGDDITINAGNWLYFMPLTPLLKGEGDLSDDTRLRVFEMYSQELINIHLGQGMDITWHRGMANADSIEEEEYLQMTAYKTGTLARLSAKLGVLLADGTEEQIEAAGKFAEAVGVGFQIQDDILNITESELAEGKGLGDDVTEGKRSLLVIHTLQEASEEDRERLLEILDMHTDDEELIQEAIDIIKKYDSVDYCKRRAREIVTEAWDEVEPMIPDSPAKEQLHTFARFLIERDI